MTDDREPPTTNSQVIALERSRERRLRLLIVEDQRRILDRQRKLLENHQERLEIVGTARNGMDAVERCAVLRPDVMLLDLGLPDIDGIEVTRRVRAQCPDTEILIFTIFDEEERVLEAVRAGASGYLLKGAPVQRIVEALFDVHRGGSVIQPQLARALLRRFQVPAGAKTALTPRETEILNLIAKGLSNREAADALGLSRATVRTHLEHIYAKLDVSNRTEAVTEAIRRGIIEA